MSPRIDHIASNDFLMRLICSGVIDRIAAIYAAKSLVNHHMRQRYMQWRSSLSVSGYAKIVCCAMQLSPTADIPPRVNSRNHSAPITDSENVRLTPDKDIRPELRS